eukprot:3624887-Pleurochrysis_carterae.AAC.9
MINYRSCISHVLIILLARKHSRTTHNSFRSLITFGSLYIFTHTAQRLDDAVGLLCRCDAGLPVSSSSLPPIHSSSSAGARSVFLSACRFLLKPTRRGLETPRSLSGGTPTRIHPKILSGDQISGQYLMSVGYKGASSTTHIPQNFLVVVIPRKFRPFRHCFLIWLAVGGKAVWWRGSLGGMRFCRIAVPPTLLLVHKYTLCCPGVLSPPPSPTADVPGEADGSEHSARHQCSARTASTDCCEAQHSKALVYE